MLDASQVQAKTLAILAGLAQEPKAWLEPSQLYPRLVALLRDEAGYQNCALFLTNGDGHLDEAAALGCRSGQAQRKYPLPYLCLAGGQVGEDAFLINNVEAIPAAQQGSSLGRGSSLGVLLRASQHPDSTPPGGVEDGVIGALLVEDEKVDAFNTADCDLLQSVAAPFAAAVEVARHYQQVREMALYDELTGLHNRRFLFEYVEMEMARASRTSQAVSLAIIDMDRLKKINDVYGHLMGDRVLHIMAEALARNIRAYDVLARYGGDEFILVMPTTRWSAAEALMLRLMAASDRVRLDYLAQNIYIPSFSYGLASFSRDGQTFPEILAIADKRLYQAKAKKGINSHI